jgi:uncharacterized damage-inducible protein DinB
MELNATLRSLLGRFVGWRDAHVDFDDVLERIPPDKRGVRPAGVPYSPWQLLEHMRVAQHDILEFSLPGDYHEMKWPDDYWPKDPEPPSDAAWDESVAAFRDDLRQMRELATNPEIDLHGVVPHGTDQTYLREILLVADHNAYHLGQLVLVARLLGAWKS